jgi:hypothetical protein
MNYFERMKNKQFDLMTKLNLLDDKKTLTKLDEKLYHRYTSQMDLLNELMTKELTEDELLDYAFPFHKETMKSLNDLKL